MTLSLAITDKIAAIGGNKHLLSIDTPTPSCAKFSHQIMRENALFKLEIRWPASAVVFIQENISEIIRLMNVIKPVNQIFRLVKVFKPVDRIIIRTMNEY